MSLPAYRRWGSCWAARRGRWRWCQCYRWSRRTRWKCPGCCRGICGFGTVRSGVDANDVPVRLMRWNCIFINRDEFPWVTLRSRPMTDIHFFSTCSSGPTRRWRPRNASRRRWRGWWSNHNTSREHNGKTENDQNRTKFFHSISPFDRSNSREAETSSLRAIMLLLLLGFCFNPSPRRRLGSTQS